MKHQALFSSKDKSKKIKCRLLQILYGALRVNNPHMLFHRNNSYEISLQTFYNAVFRKTGIEWPFLNK